MKLSREKLSNGTKVLVKLPELEFTGKVVGIQTDLPVVGFIYLVSYDYGIISDVYPYNTCCVPETYLTQV